MKKSSRQGKEVPEGFGDACSRFAGGHIPLLVPDGLKNFWDGVGRAGEIVTKFSAEHGQVVEVIAGNKGRLWPKIQNALDSSQARSFVVVRVGKAKVGSVSDRSDLRTILEDSTDLFVRAVDAFLGSGNQSDGPDIRNYGDLLIRGDFLLDLFENSPVATEQGLMNLGASAVPFLQTMGFAFFYLMNLTFHGDDPFRHHWGLVLCENFPKTFPRTACGHDP